MFIIYGTKVTRKKLGWVADFCPICRRPQAFQLLRVGLASHIYYISFGAGRLAGFEIECSNCGTRLETDESRHAGTQKKRPGDFAALAAATMPNMPELLAERLAIEKIVKDSPKSIDPELRQRLLTEPFTLLNSALELQTKQTHIDKPIALGCLGTVVLVAVATAVAMAMPQEWKDVVLNVVVILVVLGTLFTLVQFLLANGRYYRRMILPKLGSALAPLQPDREELDAVLSRFREMKLQIGKRTKLDALWRELHPLR